MNIFVLDKNPIRAAHYLDDVRVPKMCVETAQMMASALRRHGATDEQMPLTQKGTPYKGGYHNHPCTVWAGESLDNFAWLATHGAALCAEYKVRFGKEHACEGPIWQMIELADQHVFLPDIGLTPFAQAMPDEYKDDDEVVAYRRYYQSKAHSKGGVRYDKSTHGWPDWWVVDTDFLYGVKYEVTE